MKNTLSHFTPEIAIYVIILGIRCQKNRIKPQDVFDKQRRALCEPPGNNYEKKGEKTTSQSRKGVLFSSQRLNCNS